MDSASILNFCGSQAFRSRLIDLIHRDCRILRLDLFVPIGADRDNLSSSIRGGSCWLVCDRRSSHWCLLVLTLGLCTYSAAVLVSNFTLKRHFEVSLHAFSSILIAAPMV